MVRAPEGVSVRGIDEMTAAISGLDPGTSYHPLVFSVHGVGGVHVLRGATTHKYMHGELVDLH